MFSFTFFFHLCDLAAQQFTTGIKAKIIKTCDCVEHAEAASTRQPLLRLN